MADPVPTRGVRHLHLLVADQARSIAFYGAAFGMAERFRDGAIVFLSSPGCTDDLALHAAETAEEQSRVGQAGGVEHFGITVADRGDLDRALEAVVAAGGEVVARGEHAPGVPYAYVRDPDGYLIEL